MEPLALFGFAGALIMGFVLGALGGGGAILSVPLLVAAFGFSMQDAAVSSYFILLFSAAVGLWKNRAELEMYKPLLFSVLSVAVLIFTRTLLLPAIPEKFTILNQPFTSHQLLLGVMVLVILAVAINMIRKKTEASGGKSELVFAAVMVGLLGGLVGAGGGFLIVPAMLAQRGMTMRKAVAASFVVILFNALSGITTSFDRLGHLNWQVLIPFILLGAVGVFFGGSIAQRMSEQKLRKAFVVLLFALAIGTVVQEIFK